MTQDNSNKTDKPWGYYTVLNDSQNSRTKLIEVKPNEELSLQKHSLRDEHWIIIKGEPEIVLGEDIIKPKPNDYIFIPKETVHQIRNYSSEAVQFIEVQFGECKEEDIVRLSDKYKR